MAKWKVPVPPITEEALIRFIDKIEFNEDHWLWTASLNAKGYGRFRLGGKSQLAHIVSYEWFVGPRTLDELAHQCSFPQCVSPDHLCDMTILDHRILDQTLQISGMCQSGRHTLTTEADIYAYAHPTRGQQGCQACRRESRKRYRDKMKAMSHVAS